MTHEEKGTRILSAAIQGLLAGPYRDCGAADEERTHRAIAREAHRLARAVLEYEAELAEDGGR